MMKHFPSPWGVFAATLVARAALPWYRRLLLDWLGIDKPLSGSATGVTWRDIQTLAKMALKYTNKVQADVAFTRNRD